MKLFSKGPSAPEVGASDVSTFGKLRAKIEQRLLPTVETPWSWTDNGGLYYGADGAWLYRSLPSWLMEDNSAGLDELLTTLATDCGDRAVHLLAYSWEEPASAPDQLTGDHAKYVAASLRAVVPSVMFLIGIKLLPDPAVEKHRARFGSVVTETLDQLMGEWVPNFDTYTADRGAVCAVLDAAGCALISGTRTDMLEFWYTLGIGKDVVFTERDSSINAGKDDIECVSVRSFSERAGDLEIGNTLAAGPASTMVASVRGKLRYSAERGAARLTGCSLVVGRRSGSSARTLSNTLAQQLPGVETKPLPMRQVVAVDETLPCSVESVDPHLFGVDATKLRRVGFNDATNGGDRVGLFFGMVSPGYAHPRYVDVFSTPGNVTAISGGTGSGKTFLCEHLAIQTHLLDMPTVVLTDGDDTGFALQHGPGGSGSRTCTVLDASQPGLFDPFTFLPPSLARRALHQLLTAAAELSAEELFALDGELSRLAPASMVSTPSVVSQLRDPRLAARLGRFTRTPAGRLVAAPVSSVLPTGTQVWDLASLLADIEAGPVRSTLIDFAVAAATVATAGGLLVADEVGEWRAGSMSLAVRQEMLRSSTPGPLGALVVATSVPDRLVDGALPAADTTVALSHDDPAAYVKLFASRNVAYNAELHDWLSAGPATIEDGMIGSTSLGLTWNRVDGPRGISIGPVPLDWVPALTRGAAGEYLADRVFT